jgi:PAS domain S-box-containing protein
LRPAWISYVVALAVMAAALTLRVLLDPWVGDRVPYITLFGGVIMAAWLGGFGPSMVAATLGYVGADFLFVPPRFGFAPYGPQRLVELAAYLLSCALIAALGGVMRRATRRAEASDARFRAFMRHSPSGVFLKDEQGRYVFMNRAGEQISGTTAWAGKTDLDILAPGTGAEIRAHDRHVLETGAPQTYDLEIATPQGLRTLYSVKFPLQDAEGRRYVGSITTDMTAQREGARLAAEAHERLQTVIDSLPLAVAWVGSDLRYRFANPVFASWVKRAQSDIVGRTPAEVLGPKIAAMIAPHIERALAGQATRYERRADLPGMGERVIQITFTPARVGERIDGFLALGTDVHEARQAERRKDQFLATLAHELRNPLAPIRNAAALLAAQGGLGSEARWARSVIDRQVDQMSRLIDDLLDLARITNGKLSLRREALPLSAVIQLALETSRPHIEAAGHRLELLDQAGDAWLDADATRLAQVLSNLLNNAARYTAPGGRIVLRTTLEEGSAVIVVEDNGRGFRPETAQMLFEPFVQGEQDAQPGAGLGIGLSIVRGIVELHGGTVEGWSEGPGRGSRFTIRLPGLQAPRPRKAIAPATKPDAKGMRILVADDNRDAADSLQRLLSLSGHDVRVAYDGVEAIRLAHDFSPRVAILDIGMPGADGYEVARAIRARGARVGLIALTGWGQQHDRERALAAGFDDHLTKPADAQALHELIGKICHV